MEGFERRLHRAAAEIRKEAGGRCCGDCAHARLDASGAGYCSENVNLDGNALVILRRSAPSCAGKFEPLPT